MRLLIFDTETTGLPKNRNTPAEYLKDNWPHMVSIGWMLYDSNIKQVIDVDYFVIKPQNWTVPLESSSIHGITQAIAEKDGQNLETILNKFIQIDCDAIVAHNMDFDYNVLVQGLKWDCGLDVPKFPSKVCTMKLSTEMCNIVKRGCLKWPTLKELHEFSCGEIPDVYKLHNSIDDVYILFRCLKYNDDLMEKMLIMRIKHPLHHWVSHLWKARHKVMRLDAKPCNSIDWVGN